MQLHLVVAVTGRAIANTLHNRIDEEARETAIFRWWLRASALPRTQDTTAYVCGLSSACKVNAIVLAVAHEPIMSMKLLNGAQHFRHQSR